MIANIAINLIGQKVLHHVIKNQVPIVIGTAAVVVNKAVGSKVVQKLKSQDKKQTRLVDF